MEVDRYRHRRHGDERRHHRHHRDHHRRRHRSSHAHHDLAPYTEQRESSSGSMGSLPHQQNQQRPSSVASVGAWIKAKSADWYNSSDPFGTMSLYLQTMRYLKDRRGHRHHGEHRRHHRRRHHSHHHGHHHRSRRHDGDSAVRNGEVDVGYAVRSGHRQPRNYGEPPTHLEELEMGSSASRPQSSSFSDSLPLPSHHRKKRSRSRLTNDVQMRDRVVVVCFIVVNCLLAAVGLCVAILSGLAVWSPGTYRPLYDSEVRRIFADIVETHPKACGGEMKAFTLDLHKLFPSVFPAIFAAGVVLAAVAIYGLFVVFLSSRTPRLGALHVILHIIFIIAMLAFTGLIAAYLTIYFQNNNSIETDLRSQAKDSVLAKFRGNPTQVCRDPITNFINFVHRYFRCCGVDDTHDFEQVPEHLWEGTYVGEEDARVPVPLSCCRLGRFYDPARDESRRDNFRGRRPRGWLIELCRQVDSPLYGFYQRRTAYQQGCWQNVKAFFTEPVRVALISLGVFCLLLLFAATLSFLQTRLC